MKNEPVPFLDLSPKLKHPLSLWNPLDYLRLLYWVFFFPQALRCYEEKFSNSSSVKQENLPEKLAFFSLGQNNSQIKLFIQGFFFNFIIITISINYFFQQVEFSINWLWSAIVSFVFNLIFILIANFEDRLTLGIALNIVCAIFFSLAMINITSGFGLIIPAIALISLAINLGLVFHNDKPKYLKSFDLISLSIFFASYLSFVLTLFFLFLIALGLIFGWRIYFYDGIIFFANIIGITTTIFPAILLRVDNWLIGVILNRQSCEYSRITAIPLPNLTDRLQKWLEKDWEKGIYNVNQIMKYSFQSIAAIAAVNKVLARTQPELIIHRVSKLAEDPTDWNLVRFSSTSLWEDLKSKVVKNFLDVAPKVFLFLIPFWRKRIEKLIDKQVKKIFIKDPHLRLDTLSHATAAGFWYLHEKEPEKAKVAFTVVRNIFYGEEMFTLASTLEAFKQAEELQTIAAIQAPKIPLEPYLRPNTWKAVKSLHRVTEEVRLVRQSVSRFARSFACNRAIGELREIVDRKQTLPLAERELILDIAKIWQKSLDRIAGEIGKIAITAPVSNTYIIGDPVTGSLFVGREDIIRQLVEIWGKAKQLQSVVLYGHRRMGKTSILLNIANCTDAKVKVVNINLMCLGSLSDGLVEVLMAISDAISDALNIPPPDDEALLKFPQRTFKRYLRSVLQNDDNFSLIIALDEFEIIEELIEKEQISPDFLAFLRSLVQMSPNLAFIFAGLHTLEEMTADYFQPFFASVIPIRVSFLSRAATRQILANPDPDFSLNYTGEALERIYNLTRGQPFLVQLIGWNLVRLYNDYVFEQGKKRSATFTLEDVEAVINKEFFSREKYYFTGVWGQAAKDIEGQQAIIKALASHRSGLNKDKLAEITGLENSHLNDAIKTLKRHDVIEENDLKYRIIVELFRLWVLETIVSV